MDGFSYVVILHCQVLIYQRAISEDVRGQKVPSQSPEDSYQGLMRRAGLVDEETPNAMKNKEKEFKKR